MIYDKQTETLTSINYALSYKTCNYDIPVSTTVSTKANKDVQLQTIRSFLVQTIS